MENLTQNLRQWRKDRNIVNPNIKIFIENILEELLEICYEDKKEIKFLQNEIMDLYFDKEPISEVNTVDSIKDIKIFSINETELMGYDDIKTDDEVFQEINSREQCPQQFSEWQKYGANGKWQKDRHQKDWTLYKANYEVCKL